MNAQTILKRTSDCCLAEAHERTTKAMALAESLLGLAPRDSLKPSNAALAWRWRFVSDDLDFTWVDGLGPVVNAHTREGAEIKEILDSQGVEGELETLTVLLVSGWKQGGWAFSSEAVTMEWSVGLGPTLTVRGQPACLAHGLQGRAS
jgi:hypothetical protein